MLRCWQDLAAEAEALELGRELRIERQVRRGPLPLVRRSRFRDIALAPALPNRHLRLRSLGAGSRHISKRSLRMISHNSRSKTALRAAFAMVAVGVLAGLFAPRSSSVALAHEHGRDDRGHYSIGLFGDMPYNALGKAQYPALLADLNAAPIKFSVFDGDLKAGGDGPCSDDNLYSPALANFDKLEQPLIFVPGDNDWTDCWGRYGPGTGTDDPLERLDHERRLFFSTDRSLGRTTIRLLRESTEGGAYAPYVENVRWSLGPVVYLGVNVQGSNDNYPYAGVDGETRSDAEIERMRAEQRARKLANFHWLDEGFDHAKKVGAKGVMIVWQADPNFNNEQHLADPRSYDAYPDYVAKLRDLSLGFAGQVVLVHGDSHYFKIDQPLSGPGGGVVPNFTRVETFGARNTHWVMATIDADDPRVFRFEPRIVRANVD
jgi:hypothetical protein